jgi:hypothetical protein
MDQSRHPAAVLRAGSWLFLGLVLDADDPSSAPDGRRSDFKSAQLAGDLAVEAPLVLTVASRDQARRENRCRPQSLHVRCANLRRYSAGVMPVARRNARVKLDCEKNWQSRAISDSDARPVVIIALALSSRRRLR